MHTQNEHIDKLILAYLEKMASPAQEKELYSWVKADKENERHFYSLQKVFILAQNNTSIDFGTDAALQDCMRKAGMKKAKSRTLFYAISGVAASIALFVGVWMAYNAGSSHHPAAVATNNFTIFQSGDSIKVADLEDKTSVTLQEHSTAKAYSFTDSLRRVELQGTAFFEVTHNPQHPFVIAVDFVKVRVLGTKFEVHQDTSDSSITVSVVEGRVLVTDSIFNSHVLLTASQRCTIWKHKPSSRDTLENQNFLAWKTGILEFTDTPLREAIKEIEKQYHKKFSLSTAELGNCKLNAKFHGTKFDDVKSVLALALSAKVEETDSVVHITAKPCN